MATLITYSSQERTFSKRSFTSSILLATLLALACSSQSSDNPNRESANPKGKTILGEPDNPTGSGLTVDETKIVGTAKEDQLALSIPVSLQSGSLTGELTVQLLELVSGQARAKVQVPYDLAAGTPQALTASIPLPADLTRQAPMVQYVIRIDAVGQGLSVKRSLMYAALPYELRLEGPSTPRRDKKAVYRVVTQDPRSRQPLAQFPVTLTIQQDGQTASSYTGTSDAFGVFEQELTLPTAGQYSIAANTQQGPIVAGVTDSLKVQEPGSKVLLTTDKPIYQPGQVIHLRTLALSAGNAPITGADALFEIADAKGNKLFKKSFKSDTYGIAATDFHLGDVLNQGTFKVSCTLQGQSTQKTVEVSRYALPKFQIATVVDHPWYSPGDTLGGTLDVSYFFGKPVAGGDVTIDVSSLDVGQTLLGRIIGKADASGHFTYNFTLPKSLIGIPLQQGNALINLHIAVTDTAGQVVEKDQLVTVASQPLDVVVVPESGELAAGVENRLLVFVTDPQGSPAPGAAVTIPLANGTSLTATTDAYGQAVINWTPASDASNTLNVQVTPVSGAPLTKAIPVVLQTGKEHVLVRTDKAVYQAGDTVNVQVYSTANSPSVYVDWLNDGQAVDMRTLTTKNGVASFSMPVDVSLLGSNKIQAYVVDDDGNIVRAGRTVFARDATSLSVNMTTDSTSYTPGSSARLTFDVKDEQGQPAVAALGLQVVDEAVCSLIDAKPGLLETFFQLEDAYAKPSYEIEGPRASLTDLLFHDTTVADPAAAKAAQDRAQASLSALGQGALTGIAHASWVGVVADAKTLAQPYFTGIAAQLKAALTQSVADEATRLKSQGCSIDSSYYATCGNTGKTTGVLIGENVAVNTVAYDAWGNPFDIVANSSWSTMLTLTSHGPDEVAGTTDDVTLSFSYSDLGIPLAQLAIPAVGGFNMAMAPGVGGAAAIDTSVAGSNSSTGSPRVRKDFPETLYVNPELITGPDGKAVLDLPLADSITEWRVSMLANSAQGRLGSATSGLRVFQDFFVDIDFPATLTRGDHIEFPISVYNYLDTPQTVQLSLDAGDWYTALGLTNLAVDLQPGEVKGVRFPVQVDRVGLGTLTVKAVGSKASDAVARVVRVVSDGKSYTTAKSGSLAAGTTSQSVSFPANTIVGSQQLNLQIYPAYTSQVLQGLDSILKVPTGCFEQTTSTTWPNALVTKYMKATGQITPEIQMKAESLMSAGYQRLLTFEHPGGGFSWFGTQDPAPYLSVTAFGVMEFADMATVQTVDDAMLTRTCNWLAAQQGSDGSWTGDRSEFFTFQTSKVRNTAFTLWALASAGFAGSSIGNGAAYVKAHYADETPDAYSLALIANAFALAAPNDSLLTDVFSRLDAMQKIDGDKISWDSGGTQTNFYGSGSDSAVATTALVASALLQAGGNVKTIEGALNFLTASKDTLGNFGSTQATVWTLRTLLLAATKGTKGAVGTLQVNVDGQPYTTVPLTETQADVMTTVDLISLASIGSHNVELTFAGQGQVSFNLVSGYNVPWNQATPDTQGPLAITVGYDKTSLFLNDTVTATVNLSNSSTQTQNMVLVTLGIPPGFQVLTEDLDAYKQQNVLSQYEITGKQLILYLTTLSPSSTLPLQYRLQATMPVKAADGGAEAHLYYEPTQRTVAAATTLEVVAN